MNLTTHDIFTRNNNDVVAGGLIEDKTNYAPEVYTIPAIARPGIRFNTLNRLELPTGQFRSIGEDISGSASTFKKFEHEMFYFDGKSIIDVAAYDADDGNTGDLLMTETKGLLQGSLITLGSSAYYGAAVKGQTGGGYVGIRNQLLSQYRDNPTATPITASNSNSSTSAYALWLNGDQGVHFSFGKNGLLDVKSPYRQWVGNSNSGHESWVVGLSFYAGLTIGSVNSTYAITGITQATPLTDSLVGQMLATVPVNRRIGLTLFMNRDSLWYLQKSRASLGYQPAGPTGAPAVAQVPESSLNIPIVVTDSISNTEDNS